MEDACRILVPWEYMSLIELLRTALRKRGMPRVPLTVAVTIAALVIAILQGAARDGWRIASTMREPLRIEAVPSVSDGTVLVAEVVDGDTIVLEDGTTVRYIGIDTPETVDPRRGVQCFGPEASKANKLLVEGQRVRLVADVEDRDKYGRMLRYVYLADGTFVNLELVRQGYAPAYTYPPNVAYTEEFRTAAREARAAKRGLWAGCSGVRTDRGEDAYRKWKATLPI